MAQSYPGGVRMKVEMYLLSLWLLFVLIFVLKFDLPYCWGEGCKFIGVKQLISKNVVSLSALLLGFAGIWSYFNFAFFVQGNERLAVEVDEVENINSEHLVFLATYIIPLVGLNLEHVRQVIVLCIILVSLGLVYIKTDMFYANPSLAILGFKIFKCKIKGKDGHGVIVILKGSVNRGDSIGYVQLDERVWFARKIS
jgi:hypothetical protein